MAGTRELFRMNRCKEGRRPRFKNPNEKNAEGDNDEKIDIKYLKLSVL